MDNQKVFLTKEGVNRLKDELLHLINTVRPEVIAELQAARAQGDLSENADYDAARTRQAQVETRIKELETMLSNVSLIDDEITSSIVRLGSKVVIYDHLEKREDTYLIVGPVEASPKNGKISNLSPLAKAILGKTVGTQCIVRVAKPYEVTIKQIF